MGPMDEHTAQSVLAELDPPEAGRGVSIARFTGFDADGRFQIELDEADGPLGAVSTIGLAATDVGVPVVVAFEEGDRGRPVIIGRAQERAASSLPGVHADGERVVIRAEREIELRCGDASIILTRTGKVLLRGNYVLTRSRGANKIKGAYVDIN